MMVNTKQMHKDFIASLDAQIENYKECIADYKHNILNSTKKLVEFKSFMEKQLKVTLAASLKLDSVSELNKLFKGKISFLNRKFTDTFKYIKIHLGIVVDANINIKHFDSKIENLKTKIVSFKQYKFLVSLFNETISDLIIREGYTFKLGHHLGEIRIRKKRRHPNKMPVNWNESLKTKQAIIDAGEVPYDKDTAPEGKKWLVRFTDKFGYYWYWSKYRCAISNRDAYSFNPTAGGYGNIKKLHQYRKHNPLVVTKYKT